jgi:branched-chain amino acid transport system substrate-binding protein
MKRMPTDDDAFGPGPVRADGRKLHPTCLFQVRAPEEGSRPWHGFEVPATSPAEHAFRPLAEGGCPLVRT